MNNFFKKNSSTILTIVGSVGVCITAVMSARDTVKAMNSITFEENIDVDEKKLTTKEKIKIAAPCYIPTVLTGVSTILCIFGANKLNKNIQKSLTSAYVLLDQSYKEYRNSVKEIYGEDANKNIIKNMASKQAEGSEITNEDGDTMFFDFHSLQFFSSSLESVREAVDAANEMLRMHGYVSLGTLYSFIGMDVRENDDSLGWSTDDCDGIEIGLEEMPMEDGSKGYALIFVNEPSTVLWA